MDQHRGAGGRFAVSELGEEGLKDAIYPWLGRQLTHLLAQKGHAWLIQGQSGLGQYELAVHLAKAWLCEAPKPTGACHQCSSCHGFDVRTNPDFFALMPEVDMIDLDWPLNEKVQRELEKKERKPSKEIKVEACRELITFSQSTRSGLTGKVAMVHPAERMNHVTANTLLKTLEEPPEGFKFVLSTSASHMLLPTIRSRCQTYTMTWPTHEESLQWLMDKGLSQEHALIWLQATGQRPVDALDMAHHSGLSPEDWLRLPGSVASGNVSLLKEFSGPQTVTLLQKICYDMICLAQGAQPRYFSQKALPKKVAFEALSAWSKSLITSAQTASHPYNLGLMQEALVSQAKHYLMQH